MLGLAALMVSAAAAEVCTPTEVCNSNRICTFGTTDTYDVVRRHLFRISGYPLSCINDCTCPTRNPVNEVQTMLEAAHKNNSLYSNNAICSNPTTHSAMIYKTESYPCERLFAEAQVDLFRLCGTQAGIPCMNRCTEQYQIDTPPRPCDLREDTSTTTNFVTMGAVVGGGMLLISSPDVLSDEEAPYESAEAEKKQPVNLADIL
jgi:hypothetical protein